VAWKGGVGVRSIPSTSGIEIKVLPYGTVVHVRERKHGWIRHSHGWSQTAVFGTNFDAFTAFTPIEKKRDRHPRISNPIVGYKRTLRDKLADPELKCEMDWNPDLDAKLTELCSSLAFDFPLVAKRLAKEFKDRVFTAFECRCRILQLDAKNQNACRSWEIIDVCDPSDLNWDVELMPWTTNSWKTEPVNQLHQTDSVI